MVGVVSYLQNQFQRYLKTRNDNKAQKNKFCALLIILSLFIVINFFIYINNSYINIFM